MSNALDLVVRLQSTSQDEGQHNLLQKHMSTKIEKIITQYCQELQRSLDEFNQQQKSPPTGVDLPRVAGTLVWARSLFVQVKQPHLIISDLVKR